MAFADRNLKCKECGEDFIFTATEQEFFAEKGFTHDPGRCPECRRARKTAQSQSGDRFIGERQAYSAVCAECGKETTVPFQPKEGRPVYCRDCYQNQKSRR